MKCVDKSFNMKFEQLVNSLYEIFALKLVLLDDKSQIEEVINDFYEWHNNKKNT